MTYQSCGVIALNEGFSKLVYYFVTKETAVSLKSMLEVKYET